MSLERAPEDHPGLPVRNCLDDHHDVQPCESILVLPEALADQPFQTVAPVRASNPLLRNRETEARMADAPDAGKDREIPAGRADRSLEYPLEIAPRSKAPFAPERTIEVQGQRLTKPGAPGPWRAAP